MNKTGPKTDMDHRQLLQKIEQLLPEPSQAGYFLHWAADGRPVPTFITLLPQADGTITATQGDFRERIIPVLDEAGNTRVFADEASACEWAWRQIVSAREPSPPISSEQAASNRANGDEKRRLMEERLVRWRADQASR